MARAATVSRTTAHLSLGAVALLGFAGIVTALSLPVSTVSVETVWVAPAAKPPVARVEAAPPTDYRLTSFIARPDTFRHGDWIWQDAGVPAGPMLVLVDVKTQLMHVFRSGREIGVAAVLYGADDSPTPLGVFPVRWMKAKHISSIFKSPMPYTLNLTGDGIAVHGSNVRWGWGTNGCVGVPVPFAQRLFGQMKVGDTVVIVKGATPQPGQSVSLI